jgi:hypothetical protein
MNEDGANETRKDLKERLVESLLRLTALKVQMRRNENRLEALRDALRLLRQRGSRKPEDKRTES